MSAGFRVDPDDLRSASAGIGSCAERLADAVQRLQVTVTSGNPWGADEPGSVFGAAYGAVLGHALEVYASHVGQLGSAAERLGVWAGTVQDADAAAARSANAITRGDRPVG